MSTVIETTHPLIKQVSALHQKKARIETGHLLVETRHPIEEALSAGLKLLHYFQKAGTTPEVNLPSGVVPVTVSESAMGRLSTTDSPPPCIAVFEQPSAPQALSGPTPCVLLLEEVRDPGNLGTLIRSAVAFGVSDLVLTRGTADVFSPKVIRGSAGLVFRLPVIQFETPDEELPRLFSGGQWQFYLATARDEASLAEGATVSYRDVAYSPPMALVLGNEGQGISPTLTRALSSIKTQGTQTWITIPMPGGVESLNVGVSGSIILAEAAARRGLC